jgi:hypothetical protein
MRDAPRGSCQIALVLRLPEFGNATGPDDAAPDPSTGAVAPGGSLDAFELEPRLTVKRNTATKIAPAATRIPFRSARIRPSVRDRTPRSSNRSPDVPISVSMHRVSESVTISLDRPRTIIIYVLVCFACFFGSLVLADLALVALSRYG